ncbi:hypothetical protein CMT41_01175 [Colwellia sp. MT41]|uniref:Sigma-54-dependent Fis family transcriptional regulator n=1 Tax=Colwellia marinimaniae TaxID=1513592 RepID=A0ABQ0MRV8_9GAMM|nr:hypothetical protein CMT41_01175 [Colwellia sp. MT41]GAW95106.1 sigma-54-dependent Fis family transcriptional regulator [Colwellia marinimaniae]
MMSYLSYSLSLSASAIALFVNPAAEKMTGWQSAELLGKNIHEYHHHSHANGEHYPKEECHISQTMHDGIERKITNEVFWRKDGSCFSRC